MIAEPLVSVVVPAYNHEAYVERAIRSVLDQTYGQIELVVVDDGSTDSTWLRIQDTHASTGGAFAMYTKPNGGVSSALNYAIARSRGEFVAVLASDDYFLPEKIARQMAAFRMLDDSYALVHTSAYADLQDGWLINLTGRYLAADGESCLFDFLSRKAVVVAPSVLFKRAAYEVAGGFDERLKTAEDFDFYARLAFHEYRFHYLSEPLLVKTTTGHGLGADLESLLEVFLATVEKYCCILTEEQYRFARAGVYRELGRGFAASGRFARAWEIYGRAAPCRGRWRVLLECALIGTRSLIIGSLPSGLRSRLRAARYSAIRTRQGW